MDKNISALIFPIIFILTLILLTALKGCEMVEVADCAQRGSASPEACSKAIKSWF